jgi:DNA-binding PadR family transcriptional regulator
LKKYQLGEFEELVIMTIGILNNEAYGVSIQQEMQSRLGRTISMGAIHAALTRMEDKGYLRSYTGESTPDRVGRPKRFFEITALGKKAVTYSKSIRDQFWDAIPKRVFQAKLSY